MNSKECFNRLGKAIYQIDAFYDDFAKRSNVKANLLWILYALNDGKKHSQKEICLNWSLPRTTTNTIIKELENEEYILLEQIKGEKRELNIVLTKKGRDYANNILKELYEYEQNVFNQVKDYADSLVNNLETFSNVLNNKEN